MTSRLQRKNGVGGLYRPVSWNKGRRFTSPGPEMQRLATQNHTYEGPLMRLQIEAYLDDNPDFAESYVIRKIGRKTIEKWLQLHTGVEEEEENVRPTFLVHNSDIPSGRSSQSSIGKGRPASSYRNRIRSHFSGENSPATSRRSLSATPNRKISASTFEASGLRSPILTTGEDGEVSFLTVSSQLDIARQRSRSAVLQGEQRSVTDVTCRLAAELDLSSVSGEIGRHLLHFSQGSSCSLAVSGPSHGSFQLLVNNLRRDSVDEELPAGSGETFQLDKPVTSKLSAGQLITVTGGSCPALPVQPQDEPLVLVPLRDLQSNLQGLAILSGGGVGNLQHNTVMSDLARISGICLRNATEHNAAKLEIARSQVFLDLARVIFEQQTSVEFTVLKILVNFLLLIECKRAQVMLSTKGSPTKFYKVYDLEEDDLNKEGFSDRKAPYENRFPINSSISGLVAATGETVNIGDLHSDQRFDHTINCDANLEHRSLLCMPILDSEKEILGVVSLFNKRTGCFSENDERFVEAFGIFCGIALRNVSQYEAAREAEARSQVALEIMTYHAAADAQEAEELSLLPVPSTLSLNLHSLTFSDAELKERDTLRACLRMFYELDLVSVFSIEHEVLCRWLLTVKKNYRSQVLYHNWRHAFNVAQVMFSSLLASGWWAELGPISCLALLIATLSHDLDHRGTNNMYQLATDSPLARLYSTSTLERHHLNQALLILNLEGNRILENLRPGEYTAALDIIEEAILATDLAVHFANLPQLKALSEQGSQGLDWSSPRTGVLVRAALMTGADLAGATKPWPIQKEVARRIAEEFWQQGDLERRVLSAPSNQLMDREQSDSFPQLQVGFCRGVCLPVYRALAQLCPALKPLEDGVVSNGDRWQQVADNNTNDFDPEEEGEPEDEEREGTREEEEEEERQEERESPERNKAARNL